MTDRVGLCQKEISSKSRKATYEAKTEVKTLPASRGPICLCGILRSFTDSTQ